MRLVLSSDWHTDKRTSGVDRFDDVARAVVQTVECAVDVKADAWCFLGDLCDPEEGGDVVRALEFLTVQVLRLAREGIASVLLSGNHDPYEDSSGRTVLSPLRPLRDVGPVIVADDGPRDFTSDDGVQVVCLPYPPVSRPYDPAEYLRGRVPNLPANIRTGVVLAHCTHLEGARQGEETLEMPRGRSVRLPVEEVPPGWTILCGHFHTPQTTPSGVIVPGALARLTHGEESNEPRFLVLDL